MGISLPNRGFNSPLHTFTLQKCCQFQLPPKLLTRQDWWFHPSLNHLYYPSLIPFFFPPSHALFLQPPPSLCPCSSTLSSAHFHTFHPLHVRDIAFFLHTLPKNLSVPWCCAGDFLGASDNSGVVPFTFSPHLLYTATARPPFFVWFFWHLFVNDHLLINAERVKQHLWLPLLEANHEQRGSHICMHAIISTLMLQWHMWCHKWK